MKAGICPGRFSADDFENFHVLTGNEKVMAMITRRALCRGELLRYGFHSLTTGIIDGLPGEIFTREI